MRFSADKLLKYKGQQRTTNRAVTLTTYTKNQPMIHFYTVMPLLANGKLSSFQNHFSVIAESHEDAFAKARLIKGRSLRCSIRQDHALKGQVIQPENLKAAHL